LHFSGGKSLIPNAINASLVPATPQQLKIYFRHDNDILLKRKKPFSILIVLKEHIFITR